MRFSESRGKEASQGQGPADGRRWASVASSISSVDADDARTLLPPPLRLPSALVAAWRDDGGHAGSDGDCSVGTCDGARGTREACEDFKWRFLGLVSDRFAS